MIKRFDLSYTDILDELNTKNYLEKGHRRSVLQSRILRKGILKNEIFFVIILKVLICFLGGKSKISCSFLLK